MLEVHLFRQRISDGSAFILNSAVGDGLVLGTVKDAASSVMFGVRDCGQFCL